MMKLGDIVVNEWASNRNPNKVLMFLSSTKKISTCTNLKGEIIRFPNDKELRLTVILESGFHHWDTEWRRLAAQVRSTQDEQDGNVFIDARVLSLQQDAA